MIRYFCDICQRETTHERVYLLDLDTDDSQGDRFVRVSPGLQGRLYKRRVCAVCAERAIAPVPLAKGGAHGE